MATIQERKNKQGVITSYRVVWRDAGIVKGQPYKPDEKHKAVELKNFLDANGNSFAIAAKAKKKKESTSPTVSEVVVNHIDMLRKPQPGTIAKYRRMVIGHIDGTELGDMPVDRVNVSHVLEWFDALTVSKGANQPVGKPLARKTKQTVHAIVSAAFKRASDDGIMRGNPAKGIADADLNEAREPVYLSKEDLVAIANAVPEYYRLYITFLGGTGLRYSESTALRKRDITTKDGRCIVSVSRGWKNTGKGEDVGTPKTKKGVRRVSCGKALSEAMIEHLKDRQPNDLVFQRPNGEYMRNSIFHKEVWQTTIQKMVEDGELDRAPWIHEIRHAHTTHLLQAGVPVHIVQARLGHEDPQTTLRVYARLANGDDMAAADALD